MPTLSFRARLTLRWTIAFGLLLAGANTTVYMGVRTYALRDLDAHLRTLAATEIASSTDQGGALHLHEFSLAEVGAGEFAGKFVQYYDMDGNVVAQSALLEGRPRVLDADTFARAARGEHAITTVTVDGRSGRALTAIIRDNAARYVALVGLLQSDLDAQLVRLAWVLAGVWLIGLAATAWLGFFLASRALVPIDQIAARASRIARGDIEMRLDPPRSNDEIGRMTTLLNEVLDRLHRVIDGNRRFAADASHELRSPLTAMAGEIDVALRRDRPGSEYRDTLERLRRQIEGLTALSTDLMMLVHAEERTADLVVEEVPIADVVEAACQHLATQAAARSVTLTHSGLDRLVAYAQPGLLARVIENVIANAVQYNRDDGAVHIRGFDDPAPGDAWQSGHVRIEVSDSGPGIPEAEWECIFDRFYRRESSRSRRTGGAGLGLALSRAIAAWHGGSLRVRESSPAGTTFELVMPGLRQA